MAFSHIFFLGVQAVQHAGSRHLFIDSIYIFSEVARIHFLETSILTHLTGAGEREVGEVFKNKIKALSGTAMLYSVPCDRGTNI